ncbi:TetR family transcriptional regulator [Paenibacillus sp. FSL L8-0470]|uniref:acyl-CoA-like ligand-binding transcription factor n=1 Tax=unclassified Paenibacillus TaxID=185978 RepID=UPI0030F5BFDE
MGLRERKKAKSMAEVQRHALRLFREQGYKSTTVEQIAEAAEISYSTFFRYFSSKEDVLTRDNYDPLLVSAFEAQPSELSPLQALKNAMMSEVVDMSEDELATMRERNQLVIAIPELWSAMMNSMTQMMQLIAEMVAGRVGRQPNDLAVRTFAGAVIGVNISVMLHYAEHPEEDFAAVLDEALSKLEDGLPL